ncbi:MAG: peptide ABC transporter substrate-binding protein [Phycisphaerales bacterium]|nr:peptide ABC transporter substrate-binding protein [Phycisphaerales bacterium]
MFRLALPFVVLVVVVAAAVLSDRPRPRADFVFINRGDVTTLDLQRMSWQQDLRAARIIFQGLVYADIFTPDYEARPAVAERWEVSDDGLTWVFHLRADAKWSNGDVVRPSDFVFSWRRGLLPELASDYFNFFALIRGGRAFFEWRMAALEAYAARPAAERTREAAEALWEDTLRHFDETVALTASDEARTLTVVLENRCPYFLDVVAFPCLFPVYPPLVRQYERPDGETGRLIAEHGWTKPPLLVSNGPFVLTEWRFKRYMWFEQNPHYWDRASLGVRTIMSPSVDDNNAQVLAFQTGAVDYVTEVTPAYRGDMLAQKLEFYAEHADEVAALRAQGLDQFEIDRRLPNDPRAHIHVVPSFGTYFYNFNCEPTLADGRPNPFVDARVRRAFAMMIDKGSLVNDVRRLTEPVARTITPPGAIAGYELPAGLACISDYAEGSAERAALISQAKALLAEAGYPDPTRFPTVDILFNKDAGHDLVAQAVARNWQEFLGVPVVLNMREIKVFKDDLTNHNFMVSRAGWYADYGDPTTFLELNRTGDGNNDRAYSNAEYDGLLDAAAAEPDPQTRLDILTRAERIIVERDLPMVPLFHYVLLQTFDAHRVSGISPHPRNDDYIWLVDMLDDEVGSNVPRTMGAADADRDGTRRTRGDAEVEDGDDDGIGVLGVESAPGLEAMTASCGPGQLPPPIASLRVLRDPIRSLGAVHPEPAP